MSLDGNGSYSPPAPQFPAIPNTIIYADDFNQIILDIATAISTAIFRDGQAAFTANQSMGGHKLTNLAAGVNASDAVNFGQVFVNPSFTADTVTGVAVTGSAFTVTVTLLDASGSTTVILPADSVGVTQTLGDSSLKLATTEFVALTAMSAALPMQTGRAGKFVQTDGTNATWERVAPAVQAQAYFFGQLG